VHDFGMLFVFFVMNEDAVAENLLIVLQAHFCDRYDCKILNVKLVVKY